VPRAKSPLAVALALTLVCLLAGRAAAQDPAVKEQARALNDRGTAEYRLGYYDKAASLYEEAYRLLPDPALLYNIGQAYRMAGQRDKALVAYRSYLRTSAPDAPNRDLAQKRVDELEAAGAGTLSRPVQLLPTDMPVGPTDTPALVGVTRVERAPDGSGRRWWLWGAVGALVVGGVATAVVLAGRPRDPTRGSAGIGVVP
jgi:tetratricopeptide (TPR) repeat protein